VEVLAFKYKLELFAENVITQTQTFLSVVLRFR